MEIKMTALGATVYNSAGEVAGWVRNSCDVEIPVDGTFFAIRAEGAMDRKGFETIKDAAEAIIAAGEPSDAQQALIFERDLNAERALSAIQRLRNELNSAEAEIKKAQAGNPARTDLFTPSAQSLKEVATFGATYATLWNACGLLER